MKQKISLILHSTRLYFQSGTMRTVSARIQALHVLQKCIKKYENDILHALYLDLGKSQAEGYMSEIAQVYEEIKSAKKSAKNRRRSSLPLKTPTPATETTCAWRCARNRPICSITYPYCGKEPASASTTSWPYWKSGLTSKATRRRSVIWIKPSKE